MRAVVQRVSRASVTIDGAVSGAIDRGLLVYLGVGKGDGEKESAWILDKILGLRIFPNELGAGGTSVASGGGTPPTVPKKMDKSVMDVGGALLVVSQFTLYGDVRRGRRPGFDDAMPPKEAEAMYDAFVKDAKARIRTETGRFGADMKVESLNDGPVTIWIETP